MHDFTKYFKEQEGYDRLIEGLYGKYRGLGKFSGSIRLKKINEKEASALSRFFGVTYKNGEDVTISVKKFSDIMSNSKYADFDIGVLVEEYLEITLVSNKEEKESSSKEEDEFYDSIIGDGDSAGELWLRDVIKAREGAYKLIHQRYNKNKLLLKRELENIISLINNLPKEKVLLPIYASLYTKDPHYLDLDSNHSNLFFYALSYVDKSDYPNAREEKIKLLSKYNIEIDNLSNFAITYNLLSDKECINGFTEEKESLILNIQNIISTDMFDTKKKRVFIFENPSILTEIIARNIDESVIISGGFPNTSVHLLIERLIKTGNKLYYNGDFDPEGLLIADKLKERYQDNLVLFCYSEDDYNSYVSKKKISEARLKKLSKVKAKELMVIKKLLLDNKCSAYQENNKERILKFIEELKR